MLCKKCNTITREPNLVRNEENAIKDRIGYIFVIWYCKECDEDMAYEWVLPKDLKQHIEKYKGAIVYDKSNV